MHYLIKETSTNQEVYSWGTVTGPTCPRAHFANLTSEMRPFLEGRWGRRRIGNTSESIRKFRCCFFYGLFEGNTSDGAAFGGAGPEKRARVGRGLRTKHRVCGRAGYAVRLQATLPGAIRSALQKSEGFAGCAVMVSEEEARLVTVVTFWRGQERSSKANANALWVEQLLDPYIDRQLRVNKLRAQIAWPAGMPTAKSAEFAGEVNEAGECGAE